MFDMTPRVEEFLAAVESHLDRVRAKGREVRELYINDAEARRLGLREDDATVFGVPITHMDFIRDGLAVLGLDDGSRYEFLLPAVRSTPAPSGRTPLEQAEAFLALVEEDRQPFVWIGKAWGAHGNETYLTQATVRALVEQIRCDEKRLAAAYARIEELRRS